MPPFLLRLVKKYTETRWKYKRYRSEVRICTGGVGEIDRTVVIKDSLIYVDSSSKLILKKNVRLNGISLFITNGAQVEIDEFSFLESNRNTIKPEYIINNGMLLVGNHTKLACSRLWVRFGGRCKIGDYTNINDGTELRTDEEVIIGNFCRISYNIRIWDTNTHCIYPSSVRRKMTVDYFPSFGREFEKPVTLPVRIGDGCWLGERVSVLKGSQLGENVVVGFNTTISNKCIPSNSCVVQDVKLSIK